MNQPPTNVVEFTVSELSFALKRMVEDNYEHVRVRGEVSGFRGAAASGHCYFTLKDERAALDAVVWKTTLQRLRFKPEEGLEMVATGRLTTFPSRSRYQIVVEHLEPAGAGALMALLEERRKKLAAEGLFDAARKKPIPALPRVIGVVTSPTGAVIRDILHRLRDRFPTHVLVWPVRVQGEGAAEEVAAAVRGFNAIPEGGPVARPDLLIVARGGGSIEDLWAFNEEVAVRAVAASDIPVIAAVGHETDTTLIDHAADLRAPTPTGAAEMAVPVRVELLAQTRDLASRHELAHRRAMEVRRRDLAAIVRAMPTLDDLFALRRQKFDEIAGRLRRSLRTEVIAKRQGYAACAVRLSPLLLRRAIAHKRDLLAARAGRIGQASAAKLQEARRSTTRIASRLDVELVARIVARQRQRTEQFGRLLRAFSYEAVLDRGFALVVGPGGNAVRAANQVKTGDALMVRVADGDFGATVSGPGGPKSRRSLPRRASGGEQGKLL